MDKEKLKAIFEFAKLHNKDVALELTVPKCKDTEIIIVKNKNIDYKLNYYLENYTNDLILKRCKDIKILSAKTIKFNM